MPLVFKKSAALEISGQKSRFEVVVVFTSTEQTVGALKQACAMAGSLDARITVVKPHIVPYPLPLQSPPVPVDFMEEQLCNMAKESAVEIRVCVYLCRDRISALELMLAPHSLVVLGGRKRWWPTAAGRLARKLEGAGHTVIFTETGKFLDHDDSGELSKR